MTQVVKKPPIIETVGAQFICFAVDGDYTGEYKEEVIKTETVKTVSVTENTETTPVNASGKVYENVTSTTSSDISTEQVAFDHATLAEMRGDTVHESGLIASGSNEKGRPYFAYGKIVKMFGGAYRFDWYPKCQLVANTDEAKAKEASFSEQNETLTISALPFNDAGDIAMRIYSDMVKLQGITEAKFFEKPILSDDDFKKLSTSPSVEG